MNWKNIRVYNNSQNNALKSHATMCKFVIAIAFDIPTKVIVERLGQKLDQKLASFCLFLMVHKGLSF